MKIPHVVVETTTTERRKVALTGSQVESILAKWAKDTYGLKNAEVDIDCGNDHLREVLITETTSDTDIKNVFV
jgi:hypothetical protein